MLFIMHHYHCTACSFGNVLIWTDWKYSINSHIIRLLTLKLTFMLQLKMDSSIFPSTGLKSESDEVNRSPIESIQYWWKKYLQRSPTFVGVRSLSFFKVLQFCFLTLLLTSLFTLFFFFYFYKLGSLWGNCKNKKAMKSVVVSSFDPR